MIKDAREQAQDALKRTQENMIKETKFKEFVIGQQVWLEGKEHQKALRQSQALPKAIRNPSG